MRRKWMLHSLIILCSFYYSYSHASMESLLPDERNNVELFQKFSPKVVYVHRLQHLNESLGKELAISAGAGSGIIWDKEGHIVTNYHVIKGAEDVAVSIGKQTFRARLIGAEPRKDLAVLQVNPIKASGLLKSFEPFNLAHTKDLLVGQKAIAIGNPFGLDHSLTIGVISALGRQMPGIGGVTIHEMIQTDAAINPGNSGGPLLSSQGQLIGLNTAIYSSSGSSAGIGFAIPAEDIERIVPQLIKSGRVKLAGIGIRRMEPRLASFLGVRKGILIADILPKSPAEAAGLKASYRNKYGKIKLGDVIVGLNGHPVENYDALYNLLSEMKVGESINLTVNRANKNLNFQMKTIDVAAF